MPRREAAILRLDAENDCLDLLALLYDFRRMLDALGPAQVGDVDEAVDAILDFDEGAEVGEVANATLDDGSGGITLGEVLPRILQELLHAERDAAVGGIDAEDNRVDLVAGLDQLGGVLEALGPGHLREMNEAFDSLLELNERAVVGDRENAAVDVCANGIALRGIEPRIRRELLEAERDALLVFVELEHLDLDLVADVDQIAGMGEASPAHVGDVEQAVDAAEVDERAVVGEVLDGAGEDGAFAEMLEGGGALGVLLFFEDLFAGDDDVAALLVELDDADFDLLAEIAVEVADGTNLKLRAGQECLQADVDREATLDAADHGADDRGLVVGVLLDGVPHAEALGLLVADEIAAFGLFALDDHVDDFAGLELDCAGVIEDLLDGHEALGLETYVDNEVLFSLLEDGAGDDFVAIGFDGSSFSGLLALKGFEGS